MKTKWQKRCLKIALLIWLIPLGVWLCGCGSTREIIMPDQTIYTVKARKDDMVTFKKGDIEISVDDRGRPGMIEQALGIMFMSLPDVEVIND